SILNYKLQNAKANGIKATIEAKIPEQLNVKSFDIAIIMGNLLDNAIEAVSKLENDKEITIRINFRKNTLYIHVNNTYNGTVLYKNNKISTSQTDKSHHGIGLNNIEEVIKKYNGTMEIHHTSNNFIVDILIYVE
ncbi:MAG: ATP-binding protein, partial [Herbinix sp.]|nr:ATP-binding protein [Herbinix sp.]